MISIYMAIYLAGAVLALVMAAREQHRFERIVFAVAGAFAFEH